MADEKPYQQFLELLHGPYEWYRHYLTPTQKPIQLLELPIIVLPIRPILLRLLPVCLSLAFTLLFQLPFLLLHLIIIGGIRHGCRRR